MKQYELVILVDDNETAIFLNKDIIEEECRDAKILSYTNSQEFIDDCIENAKSWFSVPSLLLLDINMPGKFGFDVLDELEDDFDEFDLLDIVLVTSSDLNRDIEVASRFHCINGYIIKPLTKEKLIEGLN